MKSIPPYRNFYWTTSTFFDDFRKSHWLIPKIGTKVRSKQALQKQPDTVIIACVLWALMQDHKNQTAAYRSIGSHLFKENFPERLRFCRICQNLSFVIKFIRFHFLCVNQFANDEQHYFLKSLISDITRRKKSIITVSSLAFLSRN